MSIQRTQRLLKTPASEVIYDATALTDDTTFYLPNDYLDLVSLSVNGVELTRSDLTTVTRLAETAGCPRLFVRHQNTLILGPRPSTGDEIKLVYHATFDALDTDDAENFLTIIAPDILVAGAMVHACRFFNDPRLDGFEAEFVTAIQDLNLMGMNDELTNARVTPSYTIPGF